MRITVFPNASMLAQALARDIADRVRRAPSLVLGLPTGRTPLLLYEQLADLARNAQVDFSKVTTFNLDEFVGLGAEEAGSYRQYMEANLFRHVNIDRRQVNFLNGAAADLDAECDRYEAAIAEAGGIDVQILGIGANGHIGFNEPGEYLVARTHRVKLRYETRAANAALFDGDIGRVPEQAVSMGMATILRSRSIVMVATGSQKSRCVPEMIFGPVTTRLPASFLQLHPDVHVMLDVDAAERVMQD